MIPNAAAGDDNALAAVACRVGPRRRALFPCSPPVHRLGDPTALVSITMRYTVGRYFYFFHLRQHGRNAIFSPKFRRRRNFGEKNSKSTALPKAKRRTDHTTAYQRHAVRGRLHTTSFSPSAEQGQDKTLPLRFHTDAGGKGMGFKKPRTAYGVREMEIGSILQRTFEASASNLDRAGHQRPDRSSLESQKA